VLESLLRDTDERILPSADSQSDIAVDSDPVPPPCHDVLPTKQDKPSQGYAPGHACHRPPFLPPADSAAQPLQHYSTESGVIDDDDDDDDGCHGECHIPAAAAAVYTRLAK